ncbi:MAG: restriction endonuclease subunit S [Oscillospiraceae bacterium]|nr:restriction endonuclease subunit S [Oscillospiraceae bacterium]
MWPYEVPGNWVWVKLIGGFAECLDNFRKPINATERAVRQGDIPYYGATGQVGWIDDYLTDEHLVLVGEDGAPFFDLIKDKAYIIEGKAWVNNHAHILRSFFGTTSNVFMMYYLNAFDYRGYVNGTTRLKLTQASMKTIPIPLPPLPEQHRIVARIESLFAKLDRAKELVQAALDRFETRKAAILHQAFTGELTAQWRAESGVGLDSWESQKLGGLGTFKLGKMLDKAKNQGTPTGYLRNVNVRWFSFELDDAKMAATESDKEVFSVKNGDLFICEGGEPGRCAIWATGDGDLIYQKALHRFRSNGAVISELLMYYLYFSSISGKLEQYFTGTTIKHLTGRSLAKIEIHLPTLYEQQETVRILDSLLEKEHRARALCEGVIGQVDLMKKAILARAFRGELGTGDASEIGMMGVE